MYTFHTCSKTLKIGSLQIKILLKYTITVIDLKVLEFFFPFYISEVKPNEIVNSFNHPFPGLINLSMMIMARNYVDASIILVINVINIQALFDLFGLIFFYLKKTKVLIKIIIKKGFCDIYSLKFWSKKPKKKKKKYYIYSPYPSYIL